MNGIQLEWSLIKRFELYDFKNFDWEKNIVILNIGMNQKNYGFQFGLGTYIVSALSLRWQFLRGWWWWGLVLEKNKMDLQSQARI